MNIIPLGLLLLGVIFLLIGWRWKSPPSEENLVALKGLAYLRNEIIRVQDQVHVLEDEILKTKRLDNSLENQRVVDDTALDIKIMDQKEAVSKELEHQEVGSRKLEHQETGLKEQKYQEIELKEVGPNKVELDKVELKKVEQKKVELKETEHIQESTLISINPQEQRERSSKASNRQFNDEKAKSMRQTSDSTPQTEYHISGKFKEVLELAARGQRIPEISQHLFISQDAVRMVLSMQSKGGTR